MFQRTVLDNQLRILTATMPHTPSVSMMICVGAGSRYEPKDLAGLSHFLEHLPFKGTRSWPTARAVSEAIEGVGGVMNASTDREMTIFWCKVARLHYRQAFSVLLDMLLNPLLDPTEMEKEREVIQEELRMTNDYPTQLVDLLIDDTMWPDQAMGRDVGGTPDTVNQISVDDVRKYMERQYNPANTVVAVSGNISEEEVIELVGDATRDWKPQEALNWEPVISGQKEQMVRIEHRRTDQSHVCLGLPGLSLSDPDRYAFSLLNGLLGDGMSSRLFLNLRERQGLAYDVSSAINNFRDCGSLVVYCGVEPKKTREAVQAIVGELHGMHLEVPLQELNKAKEYAKGRLLLRMEDSRSVAAWLGTQELLLGKIETVDEVVQQIDEITAADVARVAQRVLEEDQMRLAIVGPHRGDKLLRKLLRF
ncbi:MAG TPA: pitrilysin family protein [Dehalococcoidia bacterium]|nr:pitrilysin family protein [Dehalococcoidia bacterium]